METVCPNCDKTYEVPDSSVGKHARCKACNHIFTVEAIIDLGNSGDGHAAEPDQHSNPNDAMSRPLPKLAAGVAIAAVIIIPVLIIAALFWGHHETAKIDARHERVVKAQRQAEYDEWMQSYTAMQMAQDFVKKVLKSPASADFPSDHENHVKYLGGKLYRVTAWVDSQNGFGAMIRSSFDVEVKNIAGDRWTCEKLVFDGKTVVARKHAQPRNQPASTVAAADSQTTQKPHRWQDSQGHWHFSDEDPEADSANKVTGTGIYKWQDDQGNWHYSDKGPDN